MTLRSSINWLITLVMLLFIVTLAMLQIAASRRSTAAEMEAATQVTVQLLSKLIGEEGAGAMATPEAAAAFLDRTGRIRAHDIQVLDARGRLLHRSPPSSWKAGRSAPRWFSRLVAPQVADITLPVGSGLLRIAPDNSRMVLDAWDELMNLFRLSLLLFTLLNLLVFWFAGRALKENHIWMQLIQRHVEEERRQLALELHDEIGQSLTAVRTVGTTMASRTRDSQPELHDGARMIVEISGRMYDAMHSIVRRLRPLVLDKLGLRAALQELVETLQNRHPGIAFRLTVDGSPARVSMDVAIAAYRLVQESLTNVIRHAEASSADVKLAIGDRLVVTVQDNGKGPRNNPDDDRERHGLTGMRERIEALGGKFHWQSGNGVCVSASLPLKGPGDA